MSFGPRFDTAIAAIDSANAADPNVVVIDGVERPKELAHAELVTEWVGRLDANATEEQLLAARAHHLRRWTVPRSSYPDGRAGYLRWRRALGRQHADEVGHILRDAGYPESTVDRVQHIIRKENLRSDPAVQTHEDALCLVFLQTQFDQLADQLGREKTIDVVAKTMRKMSPGGLAAARDLALSADQVALLDAAAALLEDSAAATQAPDGETP